jgi:hypothetical protein
MIHPKPKFVKWVSTPSGGSGEYLPGACLNGGEQKGVIKSG